MVISPIVILFTITNGSSVITKEIPLLHAIAASLSPMIVQEDMIEKWDGKMPQIMSGNGGMIMDISKVIGSK
jgi:hypothetical protein